MRRGTLIAYIRAQADADAPMIPGTWSLVEESNRWAAIYPLGRIARSDVSFHARLLVRRTGFTPHRGLFVCVGAPVVLQALADRIAADGLPWTKTWATLAALRSDLTEPAVTLKTSYPDERPEGDSGERVRLFARMAGFADDDAEG
jgi:hypothetical protein